MSRRSGRPPTWSLLLLAAAVVVALAAIAARREPARSDVVPVARTASSSPGPGPPRHGGPEGSRRGVLLLPRLVVDDNQAGVPAYDRERFPTWLDLDGNGCDARADTLIAESLTPAQVDRFGGCTVVAGDWRSPYDGLETSDPGELDVDHVVPLADAWRSGAWRWEVDRRVRFANDTSDPAQLVAVSVAANRSKGDSAPDQWRPPRTDAWCDYATAWVEIKVRWRLTSTTRERDALGAMLERC